jgi:hypothetical protein
VVLRRQTAADKIGEEKEQAVLEAERSKGFWLRGERGRRRFMGVARERFRQQLNTEIQRRFIEQHYCHMDREEVDRVGKNAGLTHTQTTQEFSKLRGQVWEGELTASDEAPTEWTLHFDVDKMQQLGILPRPLP